jgi:hypothetical protein
MTGTPPEHESSSAWPSYDSTPLTWQGRQVSARSTSAPCSPTTATRPPSRETKHAGQLCDALHWTTDSIDRILERLEPIDVDESGEITRLGLARRSPCGNRSSGDRQVSMQLRNQQGEMAKFDRFQKRLEDDVRAVRGQLDARLRAAETAIEELRQADRPEEPGPALISASIRQRLSLSGLRHIWSASLRPLASERSSWSLDWGM